MAPTSNTNPTHQLTKESNMSTAPDITFTATDAETLSELTGYMKDAAVRSLSMGDIYVTANVTVGAALLDGITISDGNISGTLVPELVDFSKEDISGVAENLATFSTEQLAAAEVTEGDESKGLRDMALRFFTASTVIAAAYLV